jgi:hypothetical protein
MRWVGHEACIGEIRSAYNIQVGKPERKRPDGRTTGRSWDDIRMDCREAGWNGVDWMHLAQNRDQ